MSSDFVRTVLLAIGALLPIVDPLGSEPIYQRLTAGLHREARPALARLVAFDSFVLLLGSALIGAYVLDFFGVSVPAVQVAGGIVVCALAWPLLTSPDAPEAATRTSTAQAAAAEWRQRAFFPLTLPLTVGPGSISVALALGANPESSVRSLITGAAHALGILIVALLVTSATGAAFLYPPKGVAINDDPSMRHVIADYLADNDLRVTTLASGRDIALRSGTPRPRVVAENRVPRRGGVRAVPSSADFSAKGVRANAATVTPHHSTLTHRGFHDS